MDHVCPWPETRWPYRQTLPGLRLEMGGNWFEPHAEMNCTLLMPPCMPPERFVAVRMPSSGTNASLCSLPGSTPAKPEPNQTPSQQEGQPWHRLSAHPTYRTPGHSHPAGTLRATQPITPSTVSPDFGLARWHASSLSRFRIGAEDGFSAQYVFRRHSGWIQRPECLQRGQPTHHTNLSR